MSVEPLLLTTRDAAAYLGVGVREIRRLVKAGELEKRHIGAGGYQYRIVKTSLDEYFESLPTETRSG